MYNREYFLQPYYKGQMPSHKTMCYVSQSVQQIRNALRKRHNLDKVPVVSQGITSMQQSPGTSEDTYMSPKIETTSLAKSRKKGTSDNDSISADYDRKAFYAGKVNFQREADNSHVQITNYGSIRVDRPVASNVSKFEDVSLAKSNVFDTEYFDGIINEDMLEDNSLVVSHEPSDVAMYIRSEKKQERIDNKIVHEIPNQNMTSNAQDLSSEADLIGENNQKKFIHPSEHNEQSLKSNIFDDDYFPDKLTVESKLTSDDNIDHELTNTKEQVDSSSTHDSMPSNLFDEQYLDCSLQTDSVSNKSDDSVNTMNLEKKPDTPTATDTEETAFDVAMKIRMKKKNVDDHVITVAGGTESAHTQKWRGKLDSMGFRILKDQVFNIDYANEDNIVKLLKNAILYEDDKVIAINKPYGLSSHGGPKIHHSVGKLLDKFSQVLHVDDGLHLIHRLDKDTSGVMLLAKNKQVAWTLHGFFKRREVVKKYWLITKGLPSLEQGTIDIPMGESRVEGQYRMNLRPEYTDEMKGTQRYKPKGQTFEAITNYRVLSKNNMCALIECHPETGVKHQIRCHMAFGLNTPILGDHKYSHPSRLAPQRLYPDTLKALHIRQPTARYLAMHLHARSLVIPGFNDGKNLFVAAPLPRHFQQNLRWLKIRK